MLRRIVHEKTRELGRRKGAPNVKFTRTGISISDESIHVPVNFLQLLTQEYAFYLALPPNTYGVVTFPDGTNRNMNGGLHEVPRGLYKIQYIDKKEREALSDQRGNITTSGEKITLKMLFRYRVIDPLALLRISDPVETLINHINTGIPRYIGSREISEISDNPSDPKSRIHAFFQQWLNRHRQLSKAFLLTSFDIENFNGDKEHIEMRLNAVKDAKKNALTIEREKKEQELERQRAQYRLDKEEMEAKLKKMTIQNNAEIEKTKVEYEDKIQRIQQKVQSREIDVENKRTFMERKEKRLYEVMKTLSSAGYSANNPAVIKEITKLVNDHEDMTTDKIDAALEEIKHEKISQVPQLAKDDGLTNTLLDLLNPEK